MSKYKCALVPTYYKKKQSRVMSPKMSKVQMRSHEEKVYRKKLKGYLPAYLHVSLCVGIYIYIYIYVCMYAWCVYACVCVYVGFCRHHLRNDMLLHCSSTCRNTLKNIAHYKLYQNKVLLVLVGIDEDVCMVLVADNVPGNTGPPTEGGVRTSS